MEEIKNKINHLFSMLLSNKKEGKYLHPFYSDLLRVIKYKKYIFYNQPKYKFNFDKNDLENRKEIISNLVKKRESLDTEIQNSRNKYETLDHEKIKLIYESIINGDSIKNINNLVHSVSNMIIPSSIKFDKDFSLDTIYPGRNGYQFLDKKEVSRKLEGKRVINIAIIGTGPVGLFLALYLNFFYTFDQNIIFIIKLKVSA